MFESVMSVPHCLVSTPADTPGLSPLLPSICSNMRSIAVSTLLTSIPAMSRVPAVLALDLLAVDCVLEEPALLLSNKLHVPLCAERPDESA